MPDKDQYNEIIIFCITGIVVFTVLTSLLVYILLFFQKKKFQHRQQLADLAKQYSEESLKSQIELQEITFNAISQEIHDNVGQVLSLAKVQLNIFEESGDAKVSVISEAKENISKAMTDLRDIAHSLNTERIKLVSLEETLTNELQRIEKSGLMSTVLGLYGVRQEIGSQKKLVVFRIIQESLQNIIKHSTATRIKILFHFDATCFKIEISDNGHGFDTGLMAEKQTGIGIKNMIARAAMMDGSASIKSVIDEGTTVTIKMPYDR